ncbi:MAG TPA: thioredoxin family protein [Candidatus Accumulibacter sp.]|nr:thioredoxin family protein [Accumulibacter sp.]
MPVTKLRLISRSYCHLCAEMEAALAPIATEFGVAVEVLDVDSDPALGALYDELVPVLLHDGVELCHYFLEAERVREYLRGIR